MESGRNLLGQETSPYLLQHAGNPVHWRPWSADALAEAKRRDRPILLSIGYAACHWCHVMAHESFEDAETARLMNELFVNIKVDREERPDIDHIYMTALHALGQQGGWPLTLFLSPDGKPMIGGTYWPPEPRYGRPSFRQVLHSVDSAWRTQRDQMESRGLTLADHLAKLSDFSAGPGVAPADLTRVGDALKGAVDPVHGGLSGAPKFPNAPIFRFFWNEMFRRGDPSFGEALRAMLEAMNAGGIYDHLGGGYSRYSTDATWLVPHFEKMLYDNAQLLELLALAHAHRPDALYAARAEETVGWMVRDMTAERVAERAAFAASEDADSEGEEGRFYVWTEAEVDTLLGDAAAAFKRAYDVTAGGNWEGHTILRRVTDVDSAADEATLARSRAVLLGARAKRVRPGRDDKVLADWNGLAISALARAATVFGRPEWLARAEEAQDFILAEMSAPDGRVQHAWRLGRVTAAGLLDDQASMARASLALFEATGQQRRLAEAIRLARAAEAAFADGQGGYYITAEDAADVPLARPRTAADNATPAANGLLAEVFSRLWHLTGDIAWRTRAEALFRAFTGNPDQLASMPTLLAAADLLEEAATVVIAGEPAGMLASAALGAADPAIVVLRTNSLASLPAEHPAFGKSAGAGVATAYACRRSICGLPISGGDALAAALSARLA